MKNVNAMFLFIAVFGITMLVLSSIYPETAGESNKIVQIASLLIAGVGVFGILKSLMR